MRLKIAFLLVLVMPCLALAQNTFSPTDFQKMSKEQKLKTLASNPQIGEADQLLEVLMMGVNDPDKNIQKEAMGKLAATMIGLQQYVQKNGKIPVNPDNITKAQLALKAELSNPDDQLRGGAFVALAYSDAPNPDIESALLNQLAQEPNEQLKAGIIETMGFAGYESDAYAQVLQAGILDQSSYVREAAAKSAATVKPAAALPLLVQALEKYKTGIHWAPQAIGAYGQTAQPYLPNLEKLLADPTTPSDLKEAIKNAIAAIKNVPPRPSPTPSVKAVSLVNATKPTPTAAGQMTSSSGQSAKPAASPTPTVAAEKQPSSSFPVVPVVILAAVIAGAIVFLLRRKSAK